LTGLIIPPEFACQSKHAIPPMSFYLPGGSLQVLKVIALAQI